MTINDAINLLLRRYGKFGITAKMLKPLIKSGIENYGLSVRTCYNGLRMSLGERYGIDERFSVGDVAKILEISKEEAAELVAEINAERIVQSGQDKPVKPFTIIYRPHNTR